MMSSQQAVRVPTGRVDRLLLRAERRHKLGDLAGALTEYDRVLAIQPTNSFALGHAALAMRQLWELTKGTDREFSHAKIMNLMLVAIETLGAIVEFSPDVPPILRKHYAGVLFNYGKFQMDSGVVDGPAGGKAFYEAAVEQDPDLGEGWTNLGVIYADAGNLMRANACWDRALECPRNTAESHFNLSFLFLMRGDYEQGWQEYEHRWGCVTFRSSYGRPDLRTPRWEGERTGTLLLHGEQGAGDIVQMARYIPPARERCDRLVVEVLEPLVGLFADTFPDVMVTARGTVAPAHDVNCPMMSLPLVFGATLSNVPRPVPFAVKSDDKAT